jgi:hypothetical protein
MREVASRKNRPLVTKLLCKHKHFCFNKSKSSTKNKKGSEMELLNGASCKSSVVLELVISGLLVAGVGLGVYTIQHPHQTAQQQMMTALQE